MPIVWTEKFPRNERLAGYYRLLLARYRFFNRLGIQWNHIYDLKIRQIPGYKHLLKSWKNKHKGQRCFVIGNGPSLNQMDLSPLKNEITIGCNAIYKNFEEWGWHTHYLLFEDIEQTELRRKDIPGIKGPWKLAGLHNAYAFPADDRTAFLHVRNLDAEFMEDLFPQFSQDVSHVVHLASTVTYISLQLAYHFGCDPVYLIGVDHNYGELPRLYPPCKISITEDNYDLIQGIHVQKDYYKIGDVIGVPPVDYMETGYRKAREVYEAHNRRIYNAGLNSKLDVFERVDFNLIFQLPFLADSDSAQTRKSRVLFITHDVGRLGAQMSLLGLIRRLGRDHNYDVRILAREPNGDMLSDFQAEGPVEIFWTRDQPRDFGDYHRRLCEGIRQWKPDLIYANTATNGDVIDHLAGLCPVVVHVHELQWYLSLLDENRRTTLLEKTDLYIACSNAVRENLIENYNVDPVKIEVVYEAIDFDRVRTKTPEIPVDKVREQLGIPRDAVVVGNCGRIDERKGWDLFVAIADRVIKGAGEVESVYFMWIGHGPNHRDLLDEAKRRGIGDRVKAPGPQANPFPFFNSMDIALVTSRDDPFPLVVMEAGFHGNPICAFASAGGACEFIRDDCGVTVPDVDPDALADRILTLVLDKELRVRLGENARRRAEEEFDTKPIARKIAQHLTHRFGLQTADSGGIVPSEPTPIPPAPPEQTLEFPALSVGKIKVRDWESKIWEWRDLGAAQNTVTIPAGQEVFLELDRIAVGDLSFMDTLPPDAIQSIFLGRSPLTESQFKHLIRQRDLRTLDIRATPLNDAVLPSIAAIASLRAVALPVGISDAGLEWLTRAMPKRNIQRFDEMPFVRAASFTGSAPPARVVEFPSESFGLLMTRPWGLNVWNWSELGPARGSVAVPAKTELMLVVSGKWSHDLSPLEKLTPDSIQSMHLRQTCMGDQQLKSLSHLIDLRTLDLRDTKISDAGLKSLETLTQLKQLYLPGSLGAQAVKLLAGKLKSCRIHAD